MSSTRMTKFAVGAGLFAAVMLLAGCGNPEQSAAAAVAQAEADYGSALGELDPARRLRAYEAVIGDLEAVAQKYAETPHGRAIAAGRATGTVSIATLRAARDSLAERAQCYADPSVACLRPFASRSNRDAAASGSSPDAALAAAQRLVCETGFVAADAPLDPFKINKPVYAQQLVQVALAGAACDKPNEVKAAIDAYKAAEPATGAGRLNAYLSILATDALAPAWPSILADLESTLRSGTPDGDTAATLALSMAVRYAALGDASAALAKYTYFTDTLHHQADVQSKLSLASHLIIAGEADAALEIVQDGNPNNRTSYSATALHGAAAKLGGGLGLLERSGASRPKLHDVTTISQYFAPPDAPAREKYARTAGAVEAALDELVRAAPPQEIPIGSSGADATYGIIALVYQKVGAADRAAAAIDKAERVRGARAQGAQASTQEYIAPYQSLIAAAQGRHAEAVTHAQSMNAFLADYVRLLPAAIAVGGDIEQALVAANQLGARSNSSATAHTAIIEALIRAGQLDRAEQVINAFAGDARTKNTYYWQLVAKAASDGDPRRAEETATKFGLLNGPGDRLQLMTLILGSEKVAGDRKRAEPLIREVFALGEELDGAGGGANAFQRSERYLAQEAARYAFANGHSDLGIELYRAASRKDQRPLFAAFNDDMRPKDMTPIFMLAHDNLQGEPLGYVIDAGIRHLEKN